VVFTPERIVWFDAQGKVELDYDRGRDRGELPTGVAEVGDAATPASTRHPTRARSGVSTSTTAACGSPAGRPFGAEPRTGSWRRRSRTRSRTRPSGRSPTFGTVTYLVDARTYLPLEVRQRVVFDHSDTPDGGRERVSFRIEYLRYEPLPVTDRTKKLLEKGAGRRLP